MAKTRIKHDLIGEITLQKKRGIKNISLRVSRDGRLVLNLPWFVPSSVGLKFAETKINWIKSQQKNTPKPLLKSEINKLVKEAEAYLPQRLDKLAKESGYKYKKIRISKAKTRWGSCSSKKVISLNVQLLKLPENVSDYVIVHELCHIKHMNHSKEFWKEVENIMPDYKNRRKQLRNYQLAGVV